MTVIDGKALAQTIKEEVKAEVSALRERYGAPPALAVVLVGGDPASEVYVKNKIKDCAETGIRSEAIRLPEDAREEKLLEVVKKLNKDKGIHGILVQLPLPKHIDENKVLEAIAPQKDVDGFTPENAGRLLTGMEGFLPCTPAGVIALVKSAGVPIEGKRAVVVGRSNIVGKPCAVLLLREHATVTIAHSRTKDLPALCREADILVAAIGKKEFIRGDFIKEGAVVVDVGVNRGGDKLYGDVCFTEAAQKAAYITPVPGGVGPMTRAMLLKNTLAAYKRSYAK